MNSPDYVTLPLLDYVDEAPRRRMRRLYMPVSEPSIGEPSILQKKLRKAFPPNPGRRFAVHFEKLNILAVDQSLLGDGVEPPSQTTIDRARAALHQLEAENLEPTRVVASVEGGVGICFVGRDRYADIECLNTGGILGVVSNRRDRPVIWKIDPSSVGFAKAARRIRDFLSGSSDPHAAEWTAR